MKGGGGAGTISHFLLTHRHHLSLAGVADTQTSVLTGGTKQAAVSVPTDAVDEVWVVVHGDDGFTCPHVPDNYQVVTAWRVMESKGEKDISFTQRFMAVWFREGPNTVKENIGGHWRFVCVLPAVRSVLRAVGCQLTMPTRLECPSRTTTGSDRGRVKV